MTEAHKPSNVKERERIENLGGSVMYSFQNWRVNGTLSVSRAFGDVDYQPFVTSKPDYIQLDLDGEEDYFILGINFMLFF